MSTLTRVKQPFISISQPMLNSREQASGKLAPVDGRVPARTALTVIAQQTAVAPTATVANTSNRSVAQAVTSSSTHADVPGLGSLGRRIIRYLALRIAWSPRLRAPSALGPSTAGAEAISLCEQLMQGTLDPAIPAQLQEKLTAVGGTAWESKATSAAADLLSRSEKPSLLPTSTVELLTCLTEGCIRGLVRGGELHPVKLNKNRLYYDATELEGALRRHYSGETAVNGIVRVLLVEDKVIAEQELLTVRWADSRTLWALIDSGMLPSLRIGKTCLLLRHDMDRCICAIPRESITLMDTPEQVIQATGGDWRMAACGLFLGHIALKQKPQ